MKNYRNIIYLKGKESAVVGLLFFIILLILIVPIALIFGLRAIYKFIKGAQEKVSASTSEAISDLERVY